MQCALVWLSFHVANVRQFSAGIVWILVKSTPLSLIEVGKVFYAVISACLLDKFARNCGSHYCVKTLYFQKNTAHLSSCWYPVQYNLISFGRIKILQKCNFTSIVMALLASNQLRSSCTLLSTKLHLLLGATRCWKHAVCHCPGSLLTKSDFLFVLSINLLAQRYCQ